MHWVRGSTVTDANQEGIAATFVGICVPRVVGAATQLSLAAAKASPMSSPISKAREHERGDPLNCAGLQYMPGGTKHDG